MISPSAGPSSVAAASSPLERTVVMVPGGSVGFSIPVNNPSPAGLPSAERHKLIVEWNRTQAEYPRELCFHQLFEAQVKRSPSAVAVQFEEFQLSFSELNLRANRLAHELRDLGVGPDVLVGVCVEPSLEMLVGLLAIVKAGGAYVPLDPAYPKERLTFIIEDTAMGIILTQQRLVETLPASGAHVLCIDAMASDNCDSMTANPVSGVAPDHLAYIIYTSGSTGRPKGVMIPHRGLVNYLTWATQAYHVAAGRGAPVLSSISFDLTITGLFAPLLVGRCVYILSAERGFDTLCHTLQRNRNFSLLKITPAHLQLLRRQLSPTEAADRTHVIVVGGEALLGENIRFWQDHAPDTVVVNEYGPTETVVGCCVYSVTSSERFAGAVPIGRPIANTQLYVLDADMAPVPIGAKGELFIGGDGLARGYLNRPELTARSFVANPFVAEDATASAKLYRTGDLVRYLPDGNLEFLGRIDHQVKIRGFRIEPGEVEAVLSAHHSLRGAVVMARDDKFGEKHLAAYVTKAGDAAISVSELRQFLRQKLPEYMVPAAFVTLAEFPLTPNGKVDREALPPPDFVSSNGDAAHVAPRTETEIKLAKIWEKILQRPRIGVSDNFFELGGHSLIAVQVVAAINKDFGTQLDVLTFLQHPTIKDFAGILKTRQIAPARGKLVTVRTGDGGVPTIFLNTGLEFFNLASQLDDRDPLLVSDMPWAPELLEASARLDIAVLPTLAEMAAPHTALILKHGIGDARSCCLAGFSYGGPLAFEVAHQLRRAGIDLEAVFLFDADIQISGPRRLKFWILRQMTKLRRGVADGGWIAARTQVQQQQLRRQRVSAARRNAPAVVHLAGGDVPWEVFDRIWINALRRYRPRPLSTRGFLFRANETLYGEKRDYDGCLGWRGLFTNGLEVTEVAGDHWTMWREPNVSGLGAAVKHALTTLRRTGDSILVRTSIAIVSLCRLGEHPTIASLLENSSK